MGMIFTQFCMDNSPDEPPIPSSRLGGRGTRISSRVARAEHPTLNHPFAPSSDMSLFRVVSRHPAGSRMVLEGGNSCGVYHEIILKIMFPAQDPCATPNKNTLAHDCVTNTYRWVEEQRLAGATKREPPSCPICYEQIYEYDYMLRTSCMHEYHYDCIFGWLQAKGNCPTCREHIVDQEQYNLFSKEYSLIQRSRNTRRARHRS